MKRKTSQRGGFTLVELMIGVAIVSLLAAIAIPSLVHARNTTQRNTCISHLRDIDSAKHQWALENGKTDVDTPVEADVKVYIRGEKFPICPSQGDYTIGRMDQDPTCSKAADGHVMPTP